MKKNPLPSGCRSDGPCLEKKTNADKSVMNAYSAVASSDKHDAFAADKSVPMLAAPLQGQTCIVPSLVLILEHEHFQHADHRLLQHEIQVKPNESATEKMKQR